MRGWGCCMNRPPDPRSTDQARREALELEAEYRQLRSDAARDALVDRHILAHDKIALAKHQASRARTGQDALDVSDPDAVGRAAHRTRERTARTDRQRLLPLEAAAAHGSGADYGSDSAPPSTPEIRDRDCLEPDVVLAVSGHLDGLVAAVQVLCDAIDGAAQELSEGRRSGIKRIRKTWARPGGRPRGAGPGTPATALRLLMRAGGAA